MGVFHQAHLARCLLIGTLIGVLVIGCKVNYGFTGADIPSGAKSVTVELFDARAPLATPQVAQIVTETLRDLMQAQTPLALAPQGGDLVYNGTLVGYDVQPVAIQANETAALNRLTIRVDVEYTNELEPMKNSRFSVSRFADYDSNQDLVQVEAELVRTISDQLVQDIFDRTLGNW
ncbi:MAG: LptE family protein [Flavobacteriales bacterium]|nr:LptE family protein [Flavobacteriales bacterium]